MLTKHSTIGLVKFKRATLPFFMILIIIGSYLKHMDGVISSSCTALPLGHSLFS